MLERTRAAWAAKLAHKVEDWASYPWFNMPYGEQPRATESKYLELAEQAKSLAHEEPEIAVFEREAGFAVDPDWLDELALQTQVGIKQSVPNFAHGRVLYSALRRYLVGQSPEDQQRGVTIFETGTARGFSSVCMARALSDHGRCGKIVTFDVVPHREKMYWNCIADHRDGPQTRAELLSKWSDLVDEYIIYQQGYSRLEMPKARAGRINFAFLDGAHYYEDVLFEFDQIEPSQKPGDIIVIDDYNERDFPGIVKAVDEIISSSAYDGQVLSVSNGRKYVIAQRK